MIKILANGEQLQLYSNTAFAINFQSFDLNNISGRTASYTPSIRIPANKLNLTRLGLSKNELSFSAKLYSNLTIQAFDGVVELFSGRAFIQGMGKDIGLAIVPDSVSSVEDMKQESLLDLSPSANFPNTAASVTSITNPVVLDTGKYRLIPPTPVITDLSFDQALGVAWVLNNAAGGTAWTISGGSASIVLGTAGFSQSLQSFDKYKFYHGFDVEITVNFTTNNTNGIRFGVGFGGTQRLIHSTTASGAQQVTQTFRVEFNKDQSLEIFADRAGIYLNSITLTIQSISIAVKRNPDFYAEFGTTFPITNYTTYIGEVLSKFHIKERVFGFLAGQYLQFSANIFGIRATKLEKYSPQFVERHRMKATGGTNSQTVEGATYTIPFTAVEKKGIGSWNTALTIYTTANTAYAVRGQFIITATVNVTSLTSSNYKLRAVIGGVNYDSSQTITNVGITNLSIFVSDVDIDNKTVTVQLVRTVGSNPIQQATTAISIEMKALDTVDVLSYLKEDFHIPDVSVYDFFKDYIMRTGALVTTNQKEKRIEIAYLEDIIMYARTLTNQNTWDATVTGGIDWTKKRVKDVEDEQIITLTGFMNNNYFTDQNPSVNFASVLNLILENEQLGGNSEKTFYTSFFKTMEDSTFNNVLSIPYAEFSSYDAERFEVKQSGFCLIRTRQGTGSDPVVRNYLGTSLGTSFQVGSYLPWSEHKQKFYSSLQTAIKYVKVLSREYRLDKYDINELDLFRPIFDDGAWYILMSVQYRPRTKSKVKLLRVY
jgi:hypothetical protein